MAFRAWYQVYKYLTDFAYFITAKKLQ